MAGIDPLSLGLFGVSALANVGKSIATGVQGRRQLQEAQRLRDKYQRPVYEIPAAQREALALKRGLVSDAQVAGRGFMEEQVGATTASGMRGLREMSASPAALIAMAGSLYGREQTGRQQIGVMGQQQQLQNIAGLQNILGRQAQFEDRAFDINEMQPFLDAAYAASALEGAGMQNRQRAMNYGLDTLGSMGANLGLANIINNQGGGVSGDTSDAMRRLSSIGGDGVLGGGSDTGGGMDDFIKSLMPFIRSGGSLFPAIN